MCSGTTAVAALLLRSGAMAVGWLGDCRAVLCADGGAVALTDDHRLDCSDERARITLEGGTVEQGRLSYEDLLASAKQSGTAPEG